MKSHSASVWDAPSAFGYDNIALVPRVVSGLAHRTDANVSVRAGILDLNTPIVSSPMPDVTGLKMMQALAEHRTLALLHRFQAIEDQVDDWDGAFLASRVGVLGAAIGVTGDWRERSQMLYEHGCRIFCLDTANGAHQQVGKVLEFMRDKYNDAFLIAGNVASAEAFSWLESAGADAIRVGIAGGAVCETRVETGVYVPTAYSVAEAASVRRTALIIGDGGVRTPADMCKLLALGADLVMLGSALAGASEAPGPVVVYENEKYKLMRGAASFGVQHDAGNERPEYVEGRETLAKYKGSVVNILNRYVAGLRSSMSYMNARTLQEYREHATFVRL